MRPPSHSPELPDEDPKNTSVPSQGEHPGHGDGPAPSEATAPDVNALEPFRLNYHPETEAEALDLVRRYRKIFEDFPARSQADYIVWELEVGDGQEMCVQEQLAAFGREEYRAMFYGLGIPDEQMDQVLSCIEDGSDWDSVLQTMRPHISMPELFEENFDVWGEIVMGFDVPEDVLAQKILDI